MIMAYKSLDGWDLLLSLYLYIVPLTLFSALTL